MKTRSSLGLNKRVLAAAIVSSLGWSACGTQFDSVSQLDGLRVMAIQKDKPYAKPGEMVALSILVHDTGIRKAGQAEGEPRDISVAWVSGCLNPGADLYQGCLGDLSTVSMTGSLDGNPPEAAPETGALAPAINVGLGPEFSFRVPSDAISSKDAPVDPDQVRYGLNYVFFAACAGELSFTGPNSDSVFPIACLDDKGKELGARDFVAGYTGIYSYEDFTNTNPVILGLDIAGNKVPNERLCIGSECAVLPPDPARECDPEDPVVTRCEDPDAVDADCDILPVHLRVDPKSVDIDDSLTARKKADVEEQMWANFHTDRGKFKFDLSLVNDLNTGFNENPDTEYIAPAVTGPAQIWAVVRDNRGGVQWARTQVCVKD